MPDKFDRFDAYLARKQAQQRRRDHRVTPTSLLESAEPAKVQLPMTRRQLTDEQPTPTSLFESADAAAIAGDNVAFDRTTDQSQNSAKADVNEVQRSTPTLPSTTASITPASLLATRHDTQWRRDLQILALHQKMLEKLQQQPQRVAEFLEKLELRKLHGRIRHGEYLFWYCALSQWQHQAQAIASLLSMEPGPRKYRRRTLLAGLLTETERQQILLELVP